MLALRRRTRRAEMQLRMQIKGEGGGLEQATAADMKAALRLVLAKRRRRQEAGVEASSGDESFSDEDAARFFASSSSPVDDEEGGCGGDGITVLGATLRDHTPPPLQGEG